jgi:hypothetical protein
MFYSCQGYFDVFLHFCFTEFSAVVLRQSFLGSFLPLHLCVQTKSSTKLIEEQVSQVGTNFDKTKHAAAFFSSSSSSKHVPIRRKCNETTSHEPIGHSLGPGPSLEDRLPLELDVTVTGQKKIMQPSL